MKNFYFLFLLFVTGICNAQIINFPDANFKAKLLQPSTGLNEVGEPMVIDANGNGEIEVSEAQEVYGLFIANSNISDLTGISYFTQLMTLFCKNNLLTTLTIDDGIILHHLDASHNALSSINMNFNDPNNSNIDLSYNLFNSFVMEGGAHFEYLDLSHNQLTDLTVENCIIEHLYLGYNNLSAIQTIGTPSIYFDADFRNNQFSLLDLSGFYFGSGSIISIGNNIVDNILFGPYQPGNISYTSNNTFADFGNFTINRSCQPPQQGEITLTNCPNLKYFILKNGFNHTTVACVEKTEISISALSLVITNCPNLSYICVDEGEKQYIQNRINNLGLQNQVQVNSYCSFTPGGTYYTVNGTTRFDANQNGCDSSDFTVPFQKFNISSGSSAGIIISDSSGNFSIPVGTGPHTVTPIVENVALFTASPLSAAVSFPANTSPFNQNFCLASQGIHPDLEVSLIPLGVARPGFNANYKVIFKNKGNQTQSGSVEMSFDDSILDFISAVPATAGQGANLLTWNFSNLIPFETREILVTLNVNSPTETPAVNAGDTLPYAVTVLGLQPDETPVDNIASLHQTVVNSFDPNDKTCLEGNTVSQEIIGQYVHYIIRFENTGSFAAENIVVKDMIDTAKFDVTSLVPLNGSHPFVTRISNGNQVEFIFENINLPFDDASNDGYVAFKIKTKPTLVVGDTFSNNSSIYFDYNFPIVTNTATTTIQSLGNPDFEFSDAFALYPNPANHELNLKSKNGAEVKSVSIYNMLGQLLQVSTGNVEVIDVSKLSSGNYLIKVSSQKGSSATKFIKQ